VEKSESKVDVTLLARRANAPGLVELNCLRVAHVGHEPWRPTIRMASNSQKLVERQRNVLEWIEGFNVRHHASESLGMYRLRCRGPQTHCLLTRREAERQRGCGDGRGGLSLMDGKAGL
jgi:hypothetical protein